LGKALNQPGKRIYLDCHATTPLDPLVADAMRPWWEERWGNPHSNDHVFGWEANQAVENARENVASLIGAGADEIIFTSGATEANNLAILGAARGGQKNRTQILISAVEHKCVLEAAAALQREGREVHRIPVDSDGIIRIEELERLVDENTALVSVMAVNNEIGTLQPIEEVGRLCRAAGAWFHCDAAQGPSARLISVDAANVDLLSLSSHKFCGPMGIGALYGRGGVLEALEPLIYGGGQEQSVRSGTLATPLCVGFGRASELMCSDPLSEYREVARKRDQLWEGIREQIPNARINGSTTKRHPGNLNICFPGIDASLLLHQLQPLVAASTGAACTTAVQEPSHVLRAIGLSAEEADRSIRFGVGRFTRWEEIERASTLIADAASKVALAVA
jgi:cysteine desulfurase